MFVPVPVPVCVGKAHVAQLVKCLFYKNEELSLIPRVRCQPDLQSKIRDIQQDLA